MLLNLRRRVHARCSGDGEAGFTLIELLVVMLILGLLASIAMPAFFNQKGKANDAKAKEYAHSAQVAIETCYTDKGTYTGCNLAALQAIEPTIPATVSSTPTASGKGYSVAATATGGNVFTITRNETTGALTFPCTTEKTGGCPSGGSWGS